MKWNWHALFRYSSKPKPPARPITCPFCHAADQIGTCTNCRTALPDRDPVPAVMPERQLPSQTRGDHAVRLRMRRGEQESSDE